MEVGDHHLGAVEPVHQLGRHDVELAVVVVGVVGQQHAQAVADGDARRHDEERIAEPGVLRRLDLVERVPGDEHRHDHGLAAARGHLEGHAIELRVGRFVGLAQLVGQVLLARPRHALCEVDRRLDGLDLAEEEPAVAIAPLPVLQQAARRARDARVVAPAPVAHGGAHLVDVVVLPPPVVGPLGAELELLAFLLGLRHGDEVGAGAARFDDLVGDAVVGELEVLARLEERRVDDRVLDDELTHAAPSTVCRPRAPGRRRATLRWTPDEVYRMRVTERRATAREATSTLVTLPPWADDCYRRRSWPFLLSRLK